MDSFIIENSLLDIDGVLEVHDLHIWSLSIGKPALSVHLLQTDDAIGVLSAVHSLLSTKFNIHHVTVQLEQLNEKLQCSPD